MLIIKELTEELQLLNLILCGLKIPKEFVLPSGHPLLSYEITSTEESVKEYITPYDGSNIKRRYWKKVK